MNKKLISIVTIMAMLVVMIIPAWADGGDNTGDDNFGAAIYVKKDGVEGAYTLGTAKEFKLEFWASGIVGKQVVRTVSVTGDNQVSSIEYKDGGEWYDISGFNKEMTIAGNDLDRTIRVVFDKEGRYTISYGLVNTEGQDVVKDQLNIEIADGQIKIVKETETTTSAVAETTTTATAETTTTAAAETTTPATAETTTVATAETTTTAAAETTTVATAETTTTAAAETTASVAAETTTTAKVTKTQKPTAQKVSVGNTRIRKIVKTKKSAKVIYKKIAKVSGYQLQLSRSSKFKKAVTKTTKKISYKFKKLKANKKYYVRVRGYVKTSNGTAYGKWRKKNFKTAK
jgi:septal ring-binding cell division protein DamX